PDRMSGHEDSRTDRSSSLGGLRGSLVTGRGFLCAPAVAIAAFTLYRATLLPGFDFGDTGSFQTTVGSPFITPRDGYPLYFAIGNIFLWLTRAEPAYALNLASAVTAAVACGLIVLVAAELSGSMSAAVGAALLFAASYTFWSQAVIGEVYAPHLVFAPRPDRRAAPVLVRRHEVRLARHIGDERATLDAARSRGDVLVRSPAAVRRGGADARGGWPRPARRHRYQARGPHVHALRDERGLRVRLQRRRLARLLPAIASHRGPPGGAGDSSPWWKSGRRPVQRARGADRRRIP